MEQALNLTDASAALGVHRAHLCKLLKTGALAGFREGREWRIYPSELAKHQPRRQPREYELSEKTPVDLSAYPGCETKTCPKCKRELPASPEFFQRSRDRLDGLFPVCKDCERERKRHTYPDLKERIAAANHWWRLRNPDRCRELARRWREKHEDSERERQARARQLNPAGSRARVRKSYCKHREKRLEARREYGKKHRSKAREYARHYRIAFPFKFKEQTARRKAKRLGVLWEVLDYEAIFKRDQGRCHICGSEVAMTDLVFDHIIAMAVGGGHLESNVATAHYECNRRKNAQ